jgi:hypothetical protein
VEDADDQLEVSGGRQEAGRQHVRLEQRKVQLQHQALLQEETAQRLSKQGDIEESGPFRAPTRPQWSEAGKVDTPFSSFLDYHLPHDSQCKLIDFLRRVAACWIAGSDLLLGHFLRD